MASALFTTPIPDNEPVLSYAPGTPERESLKKKLDELAGQQIDIPLIIDGREVRTGDTSNYVMPHDTGHVLATWHKGGPQEIAAAIESSQRAWKEWSRWPWEERAAVLLKAADLLAGPWRDTVNASTMLGQSKTVHQAEIDAACELIDFWRFNCHYAEEIYSEQPMSSPGVWNRIEQRPLEGFVYAITPFNFTSIGGNLPTAPALMGGVSLWKPSRTSIYSNYFVMKVLQEAGLPDGVINFVIGDSAALTDVILPSPHFAGIHYTGSTEVFLMLWQKMSENLRLYKNYPRIVGETGGKDFIVAHASADVGALAAAMVRGAFEYQGQKCSAASRAYIPESLWPEVKEQLVEMVNSIKMGDPRDFRNFMCAVIDRNAFGSISEYIDEAKASADMEILVGGGYNDKKGYFIEPTIVVSQDPKSRLMCEEIFGPVLTLHVYKDSEWKEMLELCDVTSDYALTGAIFARDRAAIAEADDALRYTAGNYYINDKPTGAVVGQQPFGGGRASGTNDKAGSAINLMRWVTPRTIKENFVPPTDYTYPYMGGK
ncbi:MAG: L-glutamate gamma-semialdehyde dehydrogenase [Gemmatimonadota bacterium]|nr:MAG: L-glutamate gamma-semialdehyde dehydrogenase [Gemmatimonadota bacterium]